MVCPVLPLIDNRVWLLTYAFALGSVYGTADEGVSSRESLNTVHGYTYEPPVSPGTPPVIHANGSADAQALTTLNSLGNSGAAPLKTSHPGNDLPLLLAAGLSPIDPKAASSRAARTATPPLDTSFSQAEHGASKYPTPSTPPRSEHMLLDTKTLSASPTQSPDVEARHGDGIHSQLDTNSSVPSLGTGSVLGNPASSDGKQRLDGAPPHPTATLSLNAPGNAEDGTPRPSKSQSQPSYPIPSGSLLHPSSAAHPTTAQGANPLKEAISSPTATRPTRRNTTDSPAHPSTSTSKSKSLSTGLAPSGAPIVASTSAAGNNAVVGGAPGGGAVHDGWDSELDEDMKRQAEQIRRERKRRDLEAQEAEKIREESGKRESKGKERAHARSGSIGGRSIGGRSGGGKSLDEWRPIVGNIVGEGHVNYILMYNMLTGIRVAVSFFVVVFAYRLTGWLMGFGWL